MPFRKVMHWSWKSLKSKKKLSFYQNVKLTLLRHGASKETYDPPLTPAERDALRLRAAKADEVFSGRTVGELILDVRQTRADASEGLLGAALDAILVQCLAEPFEPWPGSLVAALVAP